MRKMSRFSFKRVFLSRRSLPWDQRPAFPDVDAEIFANMEFSRDVRHQCRRLVLPLNRGLFISLCFISLSFSYTVRPFHSSMPPPFPFHFTRIILNLLDFSYSLPPFLSHLSPLIVFHLALSSSFSLLALL